MATPGCHDADVQGIDPRGRQAQPDVRSAARDRGGPTAASARAKAQTSYPETSQSLIVGGIVGLATAQCGETGGLVECDAEEGSLRERGPDDAQQRRDLPHGGDGIGGTRAQ